MALKFQQNGSVLVRRVILVACLVLSLVFVTLYSREGESGPLHTLQNGVSGAVAPLTFVGASAGAGIDSAETGISDLTANANTLSELRDANAELVNLLAQADEYRQEAERLQALLDMKDAADIEGVGARVIGKSSTAWDQTVTIDCGSADGVDSGLTVMGSSGVVGQVIGTTEHTATVRLLTDPQSGAAAMIQSSRAQGIVRGSLEGLLYLEDLDVDTEVQVGDVVVTSGLGGSYTRGLTIGTVVKVEAQQDGATRRVVVSPNDAVTSLEEVIVVFNVGSAANDDDADAVDSTSTSSDATDDTSTTSDSGDVL